MKNKAKLRIIALISFSLFIMINNRCKKSDVDLRLPPTTVVDIDGNGYHTVTIGTQVWLRENLKTTKLNDGTPILHMQDGNAWGYMSTDAYCWYHNDSAEYASPHGALYNWHAVSTGKLCPIGWHVPTEAEWTTLLNTGIHLQKTGTGDFSALMSGGRTHEGWFDGIGMECRWWSVTENDLNSAWYVYLMSGADPHNSTSEKTSGHSVRCLKDN